MYHRWRRWEIGKELRLVEPERWCHSENLTVVGRIILKCIIVKLGGRLWIWIIWFRTERGGGTSEHENKTSVSIKGGELERTERTTSLSSTLLSGHWQPCSVISFVKIYPICSVRTVTRLKHATSQRTLYIYIYIYSTGVQLRILVNLSFVNWMLFTNVNHPTRWLSTGWKDGQYLTTRHRPQSIAILYSPWQPQTLNVPRLTSGRYWRIITFWLFDSSANVVDSKGSVCNFFEHSNS
jgi:hypothetical protein